MSAQTQDKKKLSELKQQLSRARYGTAGMFPHPGWYEEVDRLEREIAKLERKLNGRKG